MVRLGCQGGALKAKKKRDLTGMSDLLSMLGAAYPELGKRIKETDAFKYWEEAVGPQIAKHTRPVRFERGELLVEVSHPAWKSELHHRKNQVLEKLRERGVSIVDLKWIDPRPGRR